MPITRNRAGAWVGMGALVFLLAMGIAPASAQPVSDETQAVDAIRTMYAAATKDDFDLFHSVTAATFFAFDNGKRFDGDQLMTLIQGAHRSGKVYVWNVTDPEVHLSGNLAWVTYTNRGSLTDSSGTHPLTWLESVVLEKRSGQWRVLFLHSQRAA